MKVGEKEALEHIASGEVHLIVGTHALIQEVLHLSQIGISYYGMNNIVLGSNNEVVSVKRVKTLMC